MTPERWQQVKEVLSGALRVGGEERAAFLGRACQTDPSLRMEVDSLLASAPGVAEEFLKSAPAHRTQLAKGVRLGPYEIECLVGTGGMGEVYRARDTRLGRVVAIKVCLEPLQTRFEREARAISALNHPNICTLYDIGPDYLVMELVEGESLADRLKKGPLLIDKVLQYGAQIADALTTAHAQGIIHRDLKPGNIMETPKGIKLLDFGLAKYATSNLLGDAETTLTMRGAILGTPAYMAPEQLEGRDCDARTDIFALGLVLFEIATGSRAFGGSSQAQLISQIMHGEAAFEKLAPPAFRRIVERCLAKDPAKRWQLASDLKLALEDPADAQRFLETVPKTGYRFIAPPAQKQPLDPAKIELAPLPSSLPSPTRPKLNRVTIATFVLIPVMIACAATIWNYRHRMPSTQLGGRPTSLAVLPLRNLSADPEQEYFSDGMTDELITDLAKISGIKIISHTSVERYKKSTAPVPEIARELDVDAVVEGTVTRSGNRVRITAQLIDARTDTHLWAESYERDLPDTLALQDTVARDIAQEISGKVLPKGKTDGKTQGGISPGALESYLRGRYLWNRRDPDSSARAKAYFEEAIQQAPEFASAYSGLADCFSIGWGTKKDLPAAERFARKSISLEPDLAEGHASLGMALLGELQLQEAEPELRRATELNPNYAVAHHYYSLYLVTVGRLKDATAENDRARQLDPFGLAVNTIRTLILIDSHELESALTQAGHLAELAPQSPMPYTLVARVFWLQGRVPEALEAEKREGAATHRNLWVHDQEELGRVYAHSGLEATQRRAAELMERHKDSLSAAFQYGNVKNVDKVIEKLKKAKEEDQGNNVGLQMVLAPEFEFMQHDPRFVELVHRLGPGA